MRRAAVTLILAALAAQASAQNTTSAPADTQAAADRFQLDLAPAANGAEVAPASSPATDTPAPRFTLDIPIAELLANYRSKAVLDRDLPGLSTDKNLDKLRPLSLNRLAPLSGGRLTPELLERVGKDLAAIAQPGR